MAQVTAKGNGLKVTNPNAETLAIIADRAGICGTTWKGLGNDTWFIPGLFDMAFVILDEIANGELKI